VTTFYCLRFETPQIWGARSPYLYPPWTRWPSYIPRPWISFSSPPTTCRTTEEVFDLAVTLVFTVSPHLSSLYSLGTDRTENTIASRVVCRLLCKNGCLFNEFTACLLCRNLATAASFSYPVTVLCFYCLFLWEYTVFLSWGRVHTVRLSLCYTIMACSWSYTPILNIGTRSRGVVSITLWLFNLRATILRYSLQRSRLDSRPSLSVMAKDGTFAITRNWSHAVQTAVISLTVRHEFWK
jgi:hypothetical protein